jgi:hypothetical protein
MELSKSTFKSQELKTGQVVVGVTPTPIALKFDLVVGLTLYADWQQNSCRIWIGGPNVSPQTGWPLSPDFPLNWLPIMDPSLVFACAENEGQTLYWMGL